MPYTYKGDFISKEPAKNRALTEFSEEFEREED